MKTSLQIIRENILLSENQKEKVLRKKLPLLYGEKSPFCSGVFRKNLQIIFTQKKNPHHTGKDYQYHFTI